MTAEQMAKLESETKASVIASLDSMPELEWDRLVTWAAAGLCAQEPTTLIEIIYRRAKKRSVEPDGRDIAEGMAFIMQMADVKITLR